MSGLGLRLGMEMFQTLRRLFGTFKSSRFKTAHYDENVDLRDGCLEGFVRSGMLCNKLEQNSRQKT